MKKILCLGLGWLCLSPVMAQIAPLPGLALADGGWGSVTNPAVLGTGNAGGVGFWLPVENVWNSAVPPSDLAVFINTGLFQQNFLLRHDEYLLKSSLATPSLAGITASAGYEWPARGRLIDGTAEMGLLWRPADLISLAAQTRFDRNFDPSTQVSAALRPLAGWSPWGDRLSVSVDGHLQNRDWSLLQADLIAEPIDGVQLLGQWDFRNNTWNAGLLIGLHRLEAGTLFRAGRGQTTPNWVYAFAGTQERRNLVSDLSRRMVVFEGPLKLQEGNPYRVSEGLTGSLSFRQVRERLAGLTADPRTQVLVFKNVTLEGGQAQVEELRQILAQFNQRGGKIWFLADNYGSREYLLAAGCGAKIILSPPGGIQLAGQGITQVYWKDFLADWGIEFISLRSHDSKTAFNFLTEGRMTPAEREGLVNRLAGLEAQRLDWLGQRPALKVSAREAVAQGPYFNAQKALEAGLVDQLLFPDQYPDWEKTNLQGYVTVPFLPDSTYKTAWSTGFGPHVAVIYAVGDIIYGEGLMGRSIGSSTLAQAIRSARENPQISGIILRVDSGGGSALASELIAREIQLCRSGPQAKPVVASMSNVAASGGYFISVAADKIIADEASLTGSIGVIGMVPNVSGLLAKLKLHADTVKTEDNADLASPLRPMTEDEKARLQTSITEAYQRFTGWVKQYRGLTDADLEAVGQGRVWTGRQALERHLVDQIGGFDAAVAALKDLLHTSQDLQLEEINPGLNPFNWGSILTGSLQATGGLVAQAGVLGNLVQQGFDQYDRFAAFRSGESLFLAVDLEPTR